MNRSENSTFRLNFFLPDYTNRRGSFMAESFVWNLCCVWWNGAINVKLFYLLNIVICLYQWQGCSVVLHGCFSTKRTLRTVPLPSKDRIHIKCMTLERLCMIKMAYLPTPPRMSYKRLTRKSFCLHYCAKSTNEFR